MGVHLMASYDTDATSCEQQQGVWDPVYIDAVRWSGDGVYIDS